MDGELAQTDQVELTILMPCLNEAETIEICVAKAFSFLKQHHVNGEVLIADNGSTDGSNLMAKSAGARVVYAPQKGYGAARITGIAEARGRFIIMGDCDDSYDFAALEPFMEKLRLGADLVVGNRFSGGIERKAMPLLHRYLGNPVLSFFGRLFYQTSVGDFHCGLRGFNAESIRELKLNALGMEFASEMIIKSTIVGHKIEEVPTVLKPDGRSRPPHLRSWRDGWLHLKLLMSFAPRWLFYYPGIFIFIIGLSLFLMLFFGPMTIGVVTFDTATLVLSTAGIITGAQLLFFYGLSRLFTSRFGLLPKSDRFARNSAKITVDNACIVGGVLLIVAFGAILSAVGSWANEGFSNLIASEIVRPAALAVVTAALGVQIITFGFLWSTINQSLPALGLGLTAGVSMPGTHDASNSLLHKDRVKRPD
jgi:glycosyltransferase involved in cell wall biosynthesis